MTWELPYLHDDREQDPCYVGTTLVETTHLIAWINWGWRGAGGCEKWHLSWRDSPASYGREGSGIV